MTDLVPPSLPFDNSYARELEGFYMPWNAEKAPSPKLLKWNAALAQELTSDLATWDEQTIEAVFSGNLPPEGSAPLAQAYAGHQFGGFSPQLGDGRALLLGELNDTNGARRDIQLKGSGRTPFSRGGDGKAPLAPVLREYLIGEAMHALGIPTTRGLAAVTTGEAVYREGPLQGAVLTRVAASHLRVGTFQYFAARQETAKVRQLADYAIARHYPHIADEETPYLALFDAVMQAQAKLVARWLQVGFIHGVMNTDNTTISGETIDYGPCAFMNTYDPDTVFSSIDTGGRYAYKNQPLIAQWNLARLAEALITIAANDPEEAVKALSARLHEFPQIYASAWLSGMRSKLGLEIEKPGDLELANDFLSAMEGQNVDYTLAFRHLANAMTGDAKDLRALFDDPTQLDAWLPVWRERSGQENNTTVSQVERMNSSNPVYIPRNHLVEEALHAATSAGDLAPFDALLNVLATPFTVQNGHERYAQPPTDPTEPYQTFCGT